jgi:2,4-dienoyl-CoA reductase-like NADH-dependent reductase (Old Yellow Enzyme family)
MTDLFEPTQILSLTLPNRFVRSATWEGLAAEDGAMTPALTRILVELAEGGVGLIIAGHAYVSAEGQAGPWQMGLHSDALIEGHTAMTEAVHRSGGKIVAQLAHAGHFAPQTLTGLTPRVVSAIDGLSPTPCAPLTEADIDHLVLAFAEAARRAKTAGFDGVQIHSGHGYLLSQFLSPVYNRREDQYGGSIENRSRIHRAIIRAIRNVVGEDYPILIKINSEDCLDNGLTLADSVEAARSMAEAGLNAVELSGGTLTSGKLSPSRGGINQPEKEAYFKHAALAYKKAVPLPLILVGGLRSLGVAQHIVDSGAADYISMSRPLIREPGLIRRWQSGDTTPARCLSDNLCFGPAMKGQGICCVVDQREQAKRSSHS